MPFKGGRGPTPNGKCHFNCFFGILPSDDLKVIFLTETKYLKVISVSYMFQDSIVEEKKGGKKMSGQKCHK